jgi:O-antigen/teichoic acid export membrane protein
VSPTIEETTSEAPAAAPVRRRALGAATVFSDYSSVLAARIASVVLSLGSVLLLTHLLAPAQYGVLALLTVVATLVFTVTSAWTSTAVARYGREEFERNGSVAAVTWARVALTAPLIFAAAALLVALKLLHVLPPEFSWALVWLAVGYGAVLVASEHAVLVLEAMGRIKLSALGMILQQAAIVGAIAFVYVTGLAKSPIAIASIWLAGTVVVTIAFSATAFRTAFWPASLDRTMLRRLLRFSTPMIAFTVSQYVIRSVDLVVIRAFGTAADLGIYAVAYQGYSVLQAIGTAAPPILTPLFVSLRSAREEHLIERYFERVVPQLTFILATAMGIGALFTAWLVPIVFGHGFSGAADPLTVLLFPAVLFFSASLFAPIVVLHERTKAVGAINVVAAVVNVVGDLVLIGPVDMGSTGAAVATLAALIVVFAGYFVVARQCTGVNARFPVGVFAPLIVGIGLALALPSATLAVAIGVPAVLVCGITTQLALKLFQVQDSQMIEGLDMPPRLKRLALRGLAVVAR